MELQYVTGDVETTTGGASADWMRVLKDSPSPKLNKKTKPKTNVKTEEEKKINKKKSTLSEKEISKQNREQEQESLNDVSYVVKPIVPIVVHLNSFARAIIAD